METDTTRDMPTQAQIIDARVTLPVVRAAIGGSMRAVPRFDEDVVTLAAEAGREITDHHQPQGLVVTTLSSPHAEGGIAPLLAEMLAIDGIAIECTGTVAAGGDALIVAMGMIATGVDPVLVLASDSRVDPAGGSLGAGAVAMLLGSTGDGGTVRHLHASAGWFPDVWRDAGSDRLVYGDRSFAEFSPTGDTVSSAGVVVSPTGPEIERAGVLGAAALSAHLLLVAPRKNATRQIGVHGGGLVHLFELSGGPATTRLRRAAEAVVAGGEEGPIPAPVDLALFHPYASEPRSWRERSQDLRLEGVEDTDTGEVYFPPIPEGSGRPLERVKLRRTGVVVTSTRDHVYPLGGPSSMAVVDLDGGGRFYGQTAWDFSAEIGMRVRLVPRLLHRGGGLPHYFWKLAPEETS